MEVSEQACEWKGSQVCEGAVTLETKSLLQVDNEDDADDVDAYDDVVRFLNPLATGHSWHLGNLTNDDNADKGCHQNSFLEKLGLLAQPADPPPPSP